MKKKTAILTFVTLSVIAAAFAVPTLYERTLAKTEIAVMSDMVYTESVTASGEIAKKDDGFTVTSAVNEEDITSVKVGQAVTVTGVGFEGEYKGEVTEISDTARKIETPTGISTVIDVTMHITTEDAIRTGSTADVKILTSAEKTVKVVPYESVAQDDDGTEYVYTLKDGVAIRKDVTTGLELSDGIEITSGVSENDIILTYDDDIENGNYVKVEQ